MSRGAVAASPRLRIRRATRGDLPDISAIYAESISGSPVTFGEPWTDAEAEKWLSEHGPRHPVLVAETGEGVTGWVSLNPWPIPAFAETGDISLYVDKGWRRRGIGRRLLETILVEGDRLGFHTLVAYIMDANVASHYLFETAGFRWTGLFRQIGRKGNRRHDLAIFQRFREPDPA